MSAGAAAAAANATMMAIRSFGVVVTLAPDQFLEIVEKQEEPLVVASAEGFFSTQYRYVVSYKGLAFFTKSTTQLQMPAGTEVVQAKNVYVPGS